MLGPRGLPILRLGLFRVLFTFLDLLTALLQSLLHLLERLSKWLWALEVHSGRVGDFPNLQP